MKYNNIEDFINKYSLKNKYNEIKNFDYVPEPLINYFDKPIGLFDPLGENINPLTGKEYKNLYINEPEKLIFNNSGEMIQYDQTYKNLSITWVKLMMYEELMSIMKTIKSKVSMIKAGTGVGKTVITPLAVLQYYNFQKKIMCTVPKQKLAKGAAEFAAKRLDVQFGNEVGYKFNMNNLSAAIGIANLESIQSVLSAHRKNAQTYINLLSSHDKISLLENKPSSLSSHWVFTLRLNLTEKERDVVLKRLNDQGIGAGLVHLPNYVYSAFKEFQLPLPNTENFAATQLSLPCGWWLEEKDCKLIAITLLKELDKVAI
jgi:hypothetical protein